MIHHCKRFKTQYALVLLLTILSFTTQAQNDKPVEEKKPVAQLTAEQWKALEGYYQNARNKEMYLQISAKGNVLIEKLLWNNNELKLTPESELDFVGESEGEPVRISFKKDSTGNIAQIQFNRNNIFTKTKDYKPIVRIEMTHTPAQLKKFEGLYSIKQRDEERFIQFTEKENKLILKQHWDSKEVVLLPESDSNFFSKEAPLFSLLFTKDNDGNIAKALVNKRDNWEKVKKAAPTAEQLKALEGKYQFKDDPDNEIQLIVKKNTLVLKQLWDKKEITLEPYTANYFYNSAESYPLQISRDDKGAVSQLLVLGMDVFVPVK
jgi:uncharacterized protein YrzB (UPF0473 family)